MKISWKRQKSKKGEMEPRLVPTPLQTFRALVVPGRAAAETKKCPPLPPNPIELKEGDNYLGRESNLTNIPDRRLSRVQLKIVWNQKESRATIERVGSNSSVVYFDGSKEGITLQNGDAPLELVSGSIVSLLPGLYGYTFLLEPPSASKSTTTQPTTTPTTTTPSKKPSKRLLIDLNDEEEEEKVPEWVAEKRLKVDNGYEEWPPVDPTATPTTTTPSPSASSSSKGPTADSAATDVALIAKVHEIQGILPGVSSTRIEAVLKQAGGDAEKALDMLLSDSSAFGPPDVDTTIVLMDEDKPRHPTTTTTTTTTTTAATTITPPTPTIGVPPKIDSSTTSTTTTATATTTPSSKENGGEGTPAADDMDARIAKELQDAYDTAEAQKAKLQRAEEEAKSQVEIIKLLMAEKETAENSSRELQEVRNELDKLYLPGEREARDGTTMKVFTLLPERGFDTDASQIHFRTAESQFYRLCETYGNYKVTKVEYVVNPPLVKAFEKKRLELAGRLDWEDCKPILAFHGTAEKNIMSICKNNFDFSRIGSATGDMGYYGKGIYFSEYSSYSMPYVHGGQKLLLCKVLIGNSYRMKKIQTGKHRVDGYDSHVSPCGKEIVIFEPDQILPCYIIHYGHGKGKKKGKSY